MSFKVIYEANLYQIIYDFNNVFYDFEH